jgi:hypothetical protein
MRPLLRCSNGETYAAASVIPGRSPSFVIPDDAKAAIRNPFLPTLYCAMDSLVRNCAPGFARAARAPE